MLASLEYAVAFLNVPLILVMGHSGCGAVGAALAKVREGTTFPGAIGSLASRIHPALENLRRDLPGHSLDEAAAENSRHTARELATGESILPQAFGDGNLKIVAALHTLSDGRLLLL